ncbi:MAG: Holliday junction branch migration protein RuvA [Bacteroidia bacterium]|nr:Holliday junction branch migration protein RuvA [Bacteroidia bacterium]
MYNYIIGKITEQSATAITLEASNVGYYLHISLNTFAKIKGLKEAKIYVHLQVKEDSHTLFGFADASERALFRQLLSVNGVGASTARMILSSQSPAELHKNIVSGNAPVLQKIKGIGGKTAQRIILDLKDKLLKLDPDSEIQPTSDNTSRDEALSALLTLGFQKKASEKVLETVVNDLGAESSVEDLVKMALAKL